MAEMNQMELSSIRETLFSHKTMCAKLADYSERCSDPHIKQMFQKASSEAGTSAQNLIQMLGG